MRPPAIPQLTTLSLNSCPNSSRDECDPWAMTTWGYCSQCWTLRRVPTAWMDAVDREIARAIA